MRNAAAVLLALLLVIQISAAASTLTTLLIAPTAQTDLAYQGTYTQTCNTTCGGTSGNCQGTALFPQFSSDGGTTWSNITASSALFTTGTLPLSCGNIARGTSCQTSWTVNGSVAAVYKIRCNATSTNTPSAVSATPSWNVTVNSSVTLSLVNPTSAVNILLTGSFNQTCNATCAAGTGGTCTSVSVYAQYSNDSGTTYFSMNSTSLLSTSSTQPFSCGSISNGAVCSASWNVTGHDVGTYKIRCQSSGTNSPNATTATPTFNVIVMSYNFTVSPTLDNFSVANNTYIDRNFTLTNTGNQVLNITCSANVTWATNTSACPTNFAAGASQNVTFRFNASGQSAGNPQVLLSFIGTTVNKTATANVMITAAPVYSFTVAPTLDNFSVVNNTYIDRNYTLTNTGNQLLNISCSSNASWATNTTACPVSLSAGSSTNVTFRFNASGQSAGNPQVLLTFTDTNAGSNTATANVTINTAASTITLTLLQPTDTTVTDPSTPFFQNCSASCSGGATCASANLTAQYSNDSGANYFDMTTSTALNTSITQPQTCGDIAVGSSCNKTWTVAGKTPGTYKIRCRSVSTNAANATSATPSFDITSNVFIATSISPGSVTFGNFDPATTDNPASNNPITITVTSNTNVNVDIYINATNLANSSNTISVGNMSISKTSGGAKTPLTLTFPGTPYYGGITPGNDAPFYFYLSIPIGQIAAEYSGVITIKTVQAGVSP